MISLFIIIQVTKWLATDSKKMMNATKSLGKIYSTIKTKEVTLLPFSKNDKNQKGWSVTFWA